MDLKKQLKNSNVPLAKSVVAIILLTVLFGTSCTAKRTTTSSSTITETVNLTTADSLRIREQVSQEYRESFEFWKREYSEEWQKNITVKIRDYDTNAPILSETGRPPVMRETTIIKTAQGAITDRQESELQEVVIQQEHTTDSVTVSYKNFQYESVEMETFTQTKPSLRWWQKTLMWLGGIFIILVIRAVYITIIQRLNPL